MAIITSENLAEMVASKADWSSRDLLLDMLMDLEKTDPSTPPELPAAYDLDDVVTALVALGLVTVASS